MKKLTRIALILTYSLLAFTGCEKDNTLGREKQSADHPYAKSRIATSSAESSAAYGNCTDPYEGMPLDIVEQMINNYRDNQQKAISNGLGINDANACWFDLERLKDYICHLEAQVDQAQCGNLKSLGLRFYYAAHNTTPPLYGVPDSYVGKHTLIIIPTYRDQGGNNVDFDPGKMNQNCSPVPLRTLKGNTNGNNVLNMASSGGGNLFAMDHGQLGPPDSASMSF